MMEISYQYLYHLFQFFCDVTVHSVEVKVEYGCNLVIKGGMVLHGKLVRGDEKHVIIPYEPNMVGTFHTHPTAHIPTPSVNDAFICFAFDEKITVIGAKLGINVWVQKTNLPQSDNLTALQASIKAGKSFSNTRIYKLFHKYYEKIYM